MTATVDRARTLKPSAKHAVAEGGDLAAAAIVITLEKRVKFVESIIAVALTQALVLAFLGWGEARLQHLPVVGWLVLLAICLAAETVVASSVYRVLSDSGRPAQAPTWRLLVLLGGLYGPLLLARHLMHPLPGPLGYSSGIAMLPVVVGATYIFGRCLSAIPLVALDGLEVRAALNRAWAGKAHATRFIAATGLLVLILFGAEEVLFRVATAGEVTCDLAYHRTRMGVSYGLLHRVVCSSSLSVPGLALLPLLSVPFHALAFLAYRSEALEP